MSKLRALRPFSVEHRTYERGDVVEASPELRDRLMSMGHVAVEVEEGDTAPSRVHELVADLIPPATTARRPRR